MRLARKLFLLVAMALTALALTATAANAQVEGAVEVSEEHASGTEGHCSAVTNVEHHVEGGCHFEVESEVHIPLVAQTAGGPVTLSNCNVHLEARVGEDGVGWVTVMKLTPEDPPTMPGCTRTACDEADSTQIPWPLTITEHGAGDEEVVSTFCLRNLAAAPGTAGTSCQVDLPLSGGGDHQYEIGDSTTYSCINLPPVSIQNVHFVNEVQGPGEPKEDIEILH